jgi:hypothetical protein
MTSPPVPTARSISPTPGIVFDASGGMTHPGVNRIFKIAGRTVTEVAKGDSLGTPNGIAWDNTGARWVLAPFGGNDVQTMKSGDTAPAKLATGPGQYDGIEVPRRRAHSRHELGGQCGARGPERRDVKARCPT